MIEEFYVMRFTPDNKHIFAAGKLKYRDRLLVVIFIV